MRELSPRTRELVAELRSLSQPALGSGRSRDSISARLLSEIANASEPAALPEILSFVLAKHEAVAQAAARAAVLLLTSLPASELPWLDERMREKATWWGGWWGMAPRDLDSLGRFGASRIALLQLASFHPSGFVRESAVRELSRHAAPASIPVFLIRCNDWVREVRAAASEALERCLTEENASPLVAALPLIHRLEDCSRADHGAFVARVMELLRRPASREALSAGMRSRDARVRRACFSLALESPCFERSELLGAGLGDDDPIVRLMIARVASRGESGDTLELLDRMEIDPFAPVRQLALSTRVELAPDQAASLYERHLLDRGRSIRGQCQRALRSAERSPAAVYRDEIRSGRRGRLVVALLGLGEVGSFEDASLSAQFLADGVAGVRAAALRATATLEEGDVSSMLHAALCDRSPRVSREARVAFLSRRSPVDAGILWANLQAASDTHVRVNSIAAAERLPRWVRLQFMLRACLAADERAADRARRGVSCWLTESNRAALSPTAADVRECSRLLSEARHRLPRAVASELEFALRGWRAVTGGAP